MKIRFIPGLMIALWIFWFPATASTSSSSADVEVLQIPFAPPLEQAIEYDVAISKLQPNKNSVTRTKQALRFSRLTDTYSVTFTMLRMEKDGDVIDLTTPAGLNRLPAELRPFLRPITLDMGTDGTLLRVRDWPEFQRALVEMFQKIPAADQTATPEQAQAFAQRMAAPYLSMTPEQAPAAVLKGWPALFGFGGLELEAGAEYEAEGEMAASLLPVNMTVRQRFSLTRDQPEGMLHYRLRSTPDPVKARAAAAQFLRSLGTDDARRANVEKAAAMMQSMKVDDTLDLQFDPTTGLPERATVDRRISFDGSPGGGEVITVSRSK